MRREKSLRILCCCFSCTILPTSLSGILSLLSIFQKTDNITRATMHNLASVMYNLGVIMYNFRPVMHNLTPVMYNLGAIMHNVTRKMFSVTRVLRSVSTVVRYKMADLCIVPRPLHCAVTLIYSVISPINCAVTPKFTFSIRSYSKYKVKYVYL